MSARTKILPAAFFWLISGTTLAAERGLPVGRIKLPPGFEIQVLTENVPNARAMALGDKGTLFVGSMREGKVYAFRIDINKAAETRVLASGLDMPVGVAFRDGDLYVSEVSRILRFDDIESPLDKPPKPVVVNDRFPTDTHHGWKFIAFGPDGMLYVPVGAPCNICKLEDPFPAIDFGIGVLVGLRPTAATYKLDGIPDVDRFLRWFAAECNVRTV